MKTGAGITLAVVAVAVAGGVWWWTQQKAEKEQKETRRPIEATSPAPEPPNPVSAEEKIKPPVSAIPVDDDYGKAGGRKSTAPPK
jgi:hypothetical protein